MFDLGRAKLGVGVKHPGGNTEQEVGYTDPGYGETEDSGSH